MFCSVTPTHYRPTSSFVPHCPCPCPAYKTPTATLPSMLRYCHLSIIPPPAVPSCLVLCRRGAAFLPLCLPDRSAIYPCHSTERETRLSNLNPTLDSPSRVHALHQHAQGLRSKDECASSRQGNGAVSVLPVGNLLLHSVDPKMGIF